MNRQFEKRLERAKNPRARKYNVKRPKKFVRPSSNVAVALSELKEDFKSGRQDVPVSELIFPSHAEVIEAFTAPMKVVGGLALAVTMDGVEAVKKCLGKKERMKILERRRTYYAAETAKREAQREQIRMARSAPLHPCPTPEMLTEAYLHRRDNDECLLRFGELILDLEEHARREFAFSGNKFTGSAGGVKAWLRANCPLLAAHYSTCQRYKRLVQEYSATKVNG